VAALRDDCLLLPSWGRPRYPASLCRQPASVERTAACTAATALPAGSALLSLTKPGGPQLAAGARQIVHKRLGKQGPSAVLGPWLHQWRRRLPLHMYGGQLVVLAASQLRRSHSCEVPELGCTPPADSVVVPSLTEGGPLLPPAAGVANPAAGHFSPPRDAIVVTFTGGPGCWINQSNRYSEAPGQPASSAAAGAGRVIASCPAGQCSLLAHSRGCA
jgi:hypothetical protein